MPTYVYIYITITFYVFLVKTVYTGHACGNNKKIINKKPYFFSFKSLANFKLSFK